MTERCYREWQQESPQPLLHTQWNYVSCEGYWLKEAFGKHTIMRTHHTSVDFSNIYASKGNGLVRLSLMHCRSYRSSLITLTQMSISFSIRKGGVWLLFVRFSFSTNLVRCYIFICGIVIWYNFFIIFLAPKRQLCIFFDFDIPGWRSFSFRLPLLFKTPSHSWFSECQREW